MNSQQLDQFLRNLTEHEIDYKNGYQKDYFSIFKERIVDGKHVLYMNFDEFTDIQSTGALLYAKKHSRFQHFPAHCHNNIEINYMYSGQCTQIINGTKYTISEGQTVFLNQDTIHQIEPLSENDILIDLNIETDYLNSNFFNRFSSESIVTNFFLDSLSKGVTHSNFIIFNSQFSERLRLFIIEFMCEWYSPSLVSVDIKNSLLTLILTELINVYKKDLSTDKNYHKKNNIIPILHYIEANYKTTSLTETAAFFNMNPNYLSNLLKKHTGSSYKELLQQQRINNAKYLLKNSTLSITEIADYVGYQNISFFYKLFKEYVGCLPGEFR